MADAQQRISELYRLFNDRNIDACLARMTEDVQWPKASEGGCVTGKEEIRAYWDRQWAEFDPHVEPVRIDVSGDRLRVAVHQVVKSLEGDLLSDQMVTHVFTLAGDLVSRMDLEEDENSGEGTSAFRRQ